MPTSKKAVRRSRVKKAFVNKKNASKRANLKLKKKAGKPGTGHVLHASWDNSKTVRQNLKKAGLVYNPNEIVKLPQEKIVEMMDLDEVLNGKVTLPKPKEIKTKKARGLAKQLEADAAEATVRQSNRPPPRLREPEVRFCTQMIKKHGTDYAAMARDHENIYQNTAAQIKRKLEIFQRTSQYKQIVEAMEE